MSLDFTSIGASIGFGGIAGFLIGYAVKKVMKIMLVIIGLFFAALAYLSSQGIISINWDKLAGASTGAMVGIQNATGAVPSAADQTFAALANIGIPLTGSFAAAFVFGFMKG